MSTVRETFGLACPNCGDDEQLHIRIATWIEVSPDGTSEASWTEHEWSDRSRCFCSGCGYHGRVNAFTVKNGGAS